MRQDFCSEVPEGYIWSGTSSRECFMCSGRLTTGSHPRLAASGPSGILVIGNTVIPHSLGFPLCFCTAADRSVGVAYFWASGTAFLFLHPFSSEEGNSSCLGDYHKLWPRFGCMFPSNFNQSPRLSCPSPLGDRWFLFLVSFKAKKLFHFYMDALISFSFMISVISRKFSPLKNVLIFLWFYFLTFKIFSLLEFFLAT